MAKLRLAPDLGQKIDPSADRSPVHAERPLRRRARRSSPAGRRRKRVEHPAEVQFPSVHPAIETIYAERRMLCAVLVASGVARRHVEDALQECILGAWRAVQAGRFRPNPSAPLRTALRLWLSGIAWRQAAHFRERASQRYELPFADPVGTLDDQAGADPHDQLAARDALRALAVLPERYRAVLTAVAVGQEVADFAIENGLPEATAWSRLRHGRAAFKEYLCGRGWRRL
jgi:RNA polymerase sigma-70 factor, ECF subfamily